jgi:hypothetical protein
MNKKQGHAARLSREARKANAATTGQAIKQPQPPANLVSRVNISYNGEAANFFPHL